MPRGHLSKHPSAFDIAASSISISPVPDDTLTSAHSFHRNLPRASDQRPNTYSSKRPSSATPSYSASPSPSAPPSVPSSAASSSSSLPGAPQPFYMAANDNHYKEFLQQRRGQAAGRYIDSDEHDMTAILKRKAQVVNTVTRAKERVSRLGIKTPTQKHHGKGWKADLHKLVQTLKQRGCHGLWGEQLKDIEGNFGSAVMVTFAFLRWVFLLDVCLSLLWIGAIVIPFFLRPPDSFVWTGIKQLFQANGLEKTWMFYGGYFYKTEQDGWYKTDYMYPCTIAVMFLLSLIAILATIARRMMGSGDAALVYTSDMCPYATLVFTSWDFGITSLEAATKLRKGIRMQLREMLADSNVKEQKLYGFQSKFKYYKRYAVLGVLWPMVMAGTVAAVYFLVSKSDIINTKLKTGYAQAALLSILVSIVGPYTVRFLVTLEDWKPSVAERVVIIKLFFLRAINLATFFYRLYEMLNYGYAATQGSISSPCTEKSKCTYEGFLCCTSPTVGEWNTCSSQLVGYCAPKCMENEVAKQILRLIVTSTVINSLLDIGLGIIYSKLLHIEQELSIPDFAIDTVYLQVLIWVGSHFSPMASTIGILCHLLTFYSKKITLKTCTPMQKLYSASRTSSLTYGVLLVALILCVIPETVFIANPSSGICGPIKANYSMYQVLIEYIERASNPIHLILEWIGSPIILGGIILLLIFIIVLLRAKLVQSYQYLETRIKEYDLKLVDFDDNEDVDQID